LWLIELFNEPKVVLKMTRSRRQFTADEKAAVVRRHLVDKVPVSDLCDELGLQPTQIYAWQKQLFENAALAFQRPGKQAQQRDSKDRKIEALQAKIQQKNEVVAELLQEHVQLKKELGEP
jgi:transposase